jgi:hypothetical protein
VLPCTERRMNITTAEYVESQRFLPVLSIRGRPEVRLAGFQSLAGKPLAGPWAPVAVAASPGLAPAKPAAASVVAPAPAPPPKPAEEPTAAADDELDAMLARCRGSEEKPAEAAGEKVDPDLAALLNDL